jgi:hypothetical protein
MIWLKLLLQNPMASISWGWSDLAKPRHPFMSVLELFVLHLPCYNISVFLSVTFLCNHLIKDTGISFKAIFFVLLYYLSYFGGWVTPLKTHFYSSEKSALPLQCVRSSILYSISSSIFTIICLWDGHSVLIGFVNDSSIWFSFA